MLSVGEEQPAMVVANFRKALADVDQLSADRNCIKAP